MSTAAGRAAHAGEPGHGWVPGSGADPQGGTDGQRGRRILLLEPFYGGSHREFAQGLAAHSRHRVHPMTLPARFWKWRMRGAALHWASRLPDLNAVDVLMATDLMSLAELKGIARGRFPSSLLYFHENQLAYPLSPGERPDVQFGFTNIASALAADRVAFSSRFQMDDFFDRLPGFLKRMPDHRPMWVVEAIRSKSAVLHPGCGFSPLAGAPPAIGGAPGEPPLVIWNHRWEFDKHPEAFFRCLHRLQDRGAAFRVAVLGERYRQAPPCFASGRRRLGDRIVHFGFEPDRVKYYRWLLEGAVVVSTATQENFGMSVVEAVRCGCIPLLPNRLAYPEILPSRYHDAFLYPDEEALFERLAAIVDNPALWGARANGLPEAMERFGWPSRIGAFDDLLSELAGQ